MESQYHLIEHRLEILPWYTTEFIEETDFVKIYEKLSELNVNILSSRPRDEKDKNSIYFTDPDGHKFEFHTGTLQDRLNYYKQEKTYMKFFD